MKRSVRGFTLVELLVVMAIISILAAIAVPNAIKYIAKGRATKARADISGIEGALTKVLADSGRGTLMQLFNATAVGDTIGAPPGVALSAAAYQKAIQLYTNSLYAILREGRGATVVETPTWTDTNGNVGVAISQVLNSNVVAKLGTSYIDLTFDPWGNLYNMYPGPWPSGNNKDGNFIPFRKYFPESNASSNNTKLPGRGDVADGFTLKTTDPDTGEQLIIGFPPSRDKLAFIWSNGENTVSGQAIYGADIPQETDPDSPPLNHYDLTANQEESLLGGGDDINNWDSNSSWTRFY